MSLPRLIRLGLSVAACAAASGALRADKHVVVIARANADYEQARQGPDGKPRAETYVFMAGNHYPGHTVDRSVSRLTFRDIAGYLAPELAKQEYYPGPSATEADLLLLVHWGTTLPKVGLQEMTGRLTQEIDHNRLQAETMAAFEVPGTIEGNFDGLPAELTLPQGMEHEREQEFERLNELTDEFSQQSRERSNVTLLGYAEELHRLGRGSWTSELERSLRFDLNSERYFIIIKAYELKRQTASVLRNRPVWTMHLNIRSPGNNFQTALDRMGRAVALFAGQNQPEAKTVRPRLTPGTVTLAPLVILPSDPREAAPPASPRAAP
ncbi:hypothetical protein Verru16b_03008 [Lacunisphaera limnophila]|uniref:Uncharacterized protein n=1 Tax=Lacunisphaera limnophila TaxID=1838286 RepID=A0A1D8AYG4_9BACT|nr:hypothetical protein [Lacunisphaera limnophila]AOS45917.1 hypothetical protein Verru16b_03008 [Lacunisphaera limnophila]